jgi:hypothetical protein
MPESGEDINKVYGLFSNNINYMRIYAMGVGIKKANGWWRKCSLCGTHVRKEEH